MMNAPITKGLRSPRPDERGFSIIEMIIAMAIITVGLVSVAGLSAYVSRANNTSNQLNVLAAAAQDQADRLRAARWSLRSDTDPRIAVGGTIPGMTPSGQYDTVQSQPQSLTQESQSSPAATTAAPYPTEGRVPYLYTLDSTNPHHAIVTGTPLGEMDVYWQVRQGPTPDLRYVTINVRQRFAPPTMRLGFTTTTILSRS